MFYIPARLLEGRVSVSGLKKHLTAKHFDQQTKQSTNVLLYDDETHKGYIGLPRHEGRKLFPDLWDIAEDRRVKVKTKPGLYHTEVKPRTPEQAAFVDALAAVIGNVTIGDAQACAGTGTGKTVSSLLAAARHGLIQLVVVVHTNRLKNGWLGSVEQKKGLRFLFGDEWVRNNVGVCQQDECDYKGKAIVIALAPSLTSHLYPEEFYNWPGAVYVDEVHKMATPTFNSVMGMFPAHVHIGMTATTKAGPMGKCISMHIGPPTITSEQTSMQPKVYRVVFEPEDSVTIINWQTKEIDDSAQSITTPLSRHRLRQELLTDLIYWRGYRRNRNILFLSDRTDQLLDIKKRLMRLGVPEEEIGVYAGSYKTGDYKLTGFLSFSDPDGNVTKHTFRALPPFASRDAAYRHVRKTIADNKGYKVIADQHKIAPWVYKPTEGEYDAIERTCRFVLATYGIFDTGIDIRRLDFGVEGTPRGDVAQAVGRVLREDEDKATPEWYSIYDKIYCEVETEILGTTHRQKRYYATPHRLEKRRRTSYRKQNAVEIRIDNAAQAIERAKQAARNHRLANPQEAAPARIERRNARPIRKLRFVKR